MKRFLALFLTIAMCLIILPSIGANSAESAGRRSLTKAERLAKNERIMAFNAELNAMIDTYGLAADMKKADDAFETGRIIVKSSKKLDYSGSIAHVSDGSGKSIIQYASSYEAEAAAKQYASFSYVEYAIPDSIITLEDCVIEDADYTEALPNTGAYISWGYGESYVNMNDYNTWIYAHAGSDPANLPQIIVAVIDTGIDSDHELLAGRIVAGGYDFVNDDADPEDDHGHGTHCSGTIIDGTLPNVMVMGIKVLNSDGQGYGSWVVNGMEWAMNNADVCNMSLGGKCEDDEMHSAYNSVIEEAYAQNIPFCVAAGNNGDDADNYCPSNCTNAITVAGSNRQNTLIVFSNYGNMVDITAPGQNIKSARIGGGKISMSGTSMACPHVSAVAAMLKSYDPDMSVEELTNLIKGNATSVSYTNGGAGILCVTDIYLALGESPIVTEPPVVTEPPIETEPPVVTDPPIDNMGDVNGDGVVDIQDAMLLARYAGQLIGEDALDLTAADMNSDGSINLIDVMLIMRHALSI